MRLSLQEVLEQQGVDIEALLAWLTKHVPKPGWCKNALVETRAYFEFCTPSVDADEMLARIAEYVDCDCEAIMNLIGDDE